MTTRRMKPGQRPGQPEEIDEGPSEEDLERFGGVTRPCPECGTELYDDTSICWKCGHALSSEAKGPPVWMMVTGLVLILAVVLFWVF